MRKSNRVHLNSTASIEKQRESFRKQMKKLDEDLDFCPFSWSFNSEISETGDIKIIFSEYNKASEKKSSYIRSFSFSDVELLLEKNCNPADRFLQPHIEGKMSSYISKLIINIAKRVTEDYISASEEERNSIKGVLSDQSEILPVYRKYLDKAIRYKAVLSALQSSIAYDSPYGGGNSSILSIPSYFRK